jgi:hypothetical protein
MPVTTSPIPAKIQAELLHAVVAMRVAMRGSDTSTWDDLSNGEQRLRKVLGPSVSKHAAASVLDVSIATLDRWIDMGTIPVVQYPGKRRHFVETTPLIQFATEVRRVRARGIRRGALHEAAAQLGLERPGHRVILRPDIAGLPRPNMLRRELRNYLESTTAEFRLAQAIEDARFASDLYKAGRRRAS